MSANQKRCEAHNLLGCLLCFGKPISPETQKIVDEAAKVQAACEKLLPRTPIIVMPDARPNPAAGIDITPTVGALALSPKIVVMPPQPTKPPQSVWDKIPAELKALNHWVAFKLETVKGRETKVPYVAGLSFDNRRHASSTNAETWTSFETATSTEGYDGVGFMFGGSGFCGIDLDHCRNAGTGEVADWAKQIVRELNSYSEASISGTGVHVIVKGGVPRGIKIGSVEMYDKARYFTCSGQRLAGISPNVETRDVSTLFKRVENREFVFTGSETKSKTADKSGSRKESVRIESSADAKGITSERELLMTGHATRGGDSFVVADDCGHSMAYKSQSEADLALCTYLAQETDDPEKIDALFRESALFREKWERTDYRKTTIGKALKSTKAADIAILTDEEAQRFFEGVLMYGVFADKAAGVANGARAIKITNAADFTAKSVDWVWRHRIIKDNLTIFAGEPDKGKSLVYIDAAAKITVGSDFFDSPNTLGGPKDVVILASEDDIESTIVPRLIVAGADRNRVHFVTITENIQDTLEESLVCLDTDLRALETTLKSYPDTAMIVIDPFDAFLGGLKMTDPTEMRPLLSSMKAAAKRLGVSFLLVIHWNKNSEATGLNRIGGAKQITAAARVAWMFQTDPDEPTLHLMLKGKGNLVKDDLKGLSFHTVGVPFTFPDGKTDEVAKVEWDGETDKQSDDLMIQSRNPDQQKGKKAGKIIAEMCAGQPQLATEIYKAGAKEGLSDRQMRRAFDSLEYTRGKLRNDVLQSDPQVQHFDWYWAKSSEDLDTFKDNLSRALENYWLEQTGKPAPTLGRGFGTGGGKQNGSTSDGSGGRRDRAGRKKESKYIQTAD